MIDDLKKLLNTSYNIKLVEMVAKNNLSGSIASNIILPIAILVIFYRLIPYMHFWLMIHFFLFFSRMYVAKKISNYLKFNDKDKIYRYLKIYTILISITAILYGYIVWQSVLYTEDIHIFVMVTIITSIAAGSVSIFVSVFYIFVLFVILQMIPLICALIYHGNGMFYIVASMATLFMLIILLNGYRQFKTLKETILLKESFKNRVDDITCELKEKNKMLLRRSRQAAMGEIIDAIAHQWKQPLNAIVMSISMLENSAKANEVIKNKDIIDCYNIVNKQITHLTNTLNEFRNFFRADSNTELVSLKVLVDSALILLKDELLRNMIKVDVSCNENIFINVNSNDIIHLILSILSNAKDEMLKSNVDSKDRKIFINCYTQMSKVIIKIKDSGKGIDKKIIDDIFKMDFTTKGKTGGTGMGLYMCYLICEKYGATIKASNDNGAVFTVALKID